MVYIFSKSEMKYNKIYFRPIFWKWLNLFDSEGIYLLNISFLKAKRFILQKYSYFSFGGSIWLSHNPQYNGWSGTG